MNLHKAFGRITSIVMEFANNGDLFQKISNHQKNGTTFDEDTVWKVFIQVGIS